MGLCRRKKTPEDSGVYIFNLFILVVAVELQF